MIEFVMVIPLLMGVIAATFLFAWAMGNQQRLRMAERYLPWRYVRHGGWMADEEISPHLLRNRATTLTIRKGRGMQWVPMGGDPSDYGQRQLEPTDQTMLDLANRVDEDTQSAGPVAGDLLSRESDHSLPRGAFVRMWVYFPSNVHAWELLNSPFEAHYIREGVEWRHNDENQAGKKADPMASITDKFLFDIDETLEEVVVPGDTLAERFRILYMLPW
ncbi:hypothetical protein LCGC14_0302350 [marine sediment metagenome]|uniref:Uncharacterized protein n=1 Tax=marine sediment metagenome TaxID=412755 RepID=A0A0F9WBF6_9ZZZZ